MKPKFTNYYFSACENVNVYPQCPTGQFISSGSLQYGRWDNSVCPGPGVNSSTPSSFDVFNLPHSSLQGVNAFFLGNSTFLKRAYGDPYPEVTKHVSKTFFVPYLSGSSSSSCSGN